MFIASILLIVYLNYFSLTKLENTTGSKYGITSMTSAEIIAIGTEILLGEIQDTNTRDIAVFLRENGIDLFRSTTVGDNPERIAAVIKEALTRTDIIITSGGLGPTVDDPTREAVASAAGRDLEYSPEFWEQIQARFRRFGRTATENNKKQAYIPSGAIPVENQVGTAPCFFVEIQEKTIISLPGVPRELQYLLIEKVQPYLRKRYSLMDIIKTRVLRVSGMGESSVDEIIADLETGRNPSVGLSAHPGQIDIRITAKGNLEKAVDTMLEETANEVKKRLGDRIFGENGDTLEGVVAFKIKAKKLNIKVLTNGFNDIIEQKMDYISQHSGGNSEIELVRQQKISENYDLIREGNEIKEGEVHLLADLNLVGDQYRLELQLIRPLKVVTDMISYGGPGELSQLWACNQTLDFLRRNID